MPIDLSDKNINSNSVLWKYLDLWKFESLIKENATFFCRADKFPNDPFEGSNPTKVKERRFKDIMSLELYYGNSNISKMSSQNEMISSYQKNVLRKQIVVNCWHINKDECNLMWNSYLSDIKNGVVIKTNINKLIQSFEKTPEILKCWEAHYLDYDKEDWLNQFESFDLIAPFIHKRNGFIKENELRLLYQIPIFNGKELDDYWNNQLHKNGMSIRLDLDKLIEDIYCSPFSEKGQIDNINRFILDNGYNFKVKESDISNCNDPIF
jgi:hypothetical protein